MGKNKKSEKNNFNDNNSYIEELILSKFGEKSKAINFENMICLNSPADICSMLKVSEQILKNTNKKIPVFIPHIDRHMLSVILYLSTFENAKLFIGDWAQSFANSSINKSLVKS